ncbi:MAG TPA: galactokinase [Candidatus Sumerlaeota bacterium]|nr:galactokinase [Candidatus Sumerlaeota bacterium]HRR29815.1 galactokinase [Candidatus Sumerlaeia bacterium]HON50251.1 galactokinase [Candidatus Sumerlaeota bacterium]HOR63468.1 galactokinase [Candidatus Sumerlaeota bacterium]HPL73433.1 galactokinase [Candidatus Sumerlaeota bacterium]
MISNEHISDVFVSIFQTDAEWISSAPGRVNIIGEHTDYNGGYVLPAAINREVKMAASLRGDNRLFLYSEYHREMYETLISTKIAPPPQKSWHNYFLGVAEQFQKKHLPVPGMNVLISGDVPLGAGLSSSAAYEVCAATLLNTISEANLAPREIALLAQAAEHGDFVGVKCGIMDQYISAMALPDHALLIDCHTLDATPVPFNSRKASIAIINSMKHRKLVGSEYNRRRAECEEGLRLISEWSKKSFSSLRHIPTEVFDRFKEQLPLDVRKRLRHNLTENDRVRACVQFFACDNFKEVGHMLYASHASLRDDFEVSCAELDAIVDIASRCEGVYGCRMTGAGFGGCALALVAPEKVESFKSRMIEEYNRMFSKTPEIYITPPSAGANVLRKKNG